MTERVAQVDDERLEVVGEASRRGRIAGSFELRDEGAESLPCVALVLGVVERRPNTASEGEAMNRRSRVRVIKKCLQAGLF